MTPTPQPTSSEGILQTILLIYFASFIVWIWQIIRLSNRKSKTHMWLILVLGILLCWILPIVSLIALFLGRSKEVDEWSERERTRYFWCGMCHVKYKEDLLGGETISQGKICRFCLDKRQRGEKQ